ncbi:MAG: hypothetical protein UMU76_09370 [Prosthecochloris sp.]|uniref:hypothetical protein n=1 Tax=Prosthecochloris sp. ZM_2 TaxID=2045206 RepID=UPI000DF75E94|nr:hypothetical protein [Prosthecochloris sp. ZM_2]MEC9487683.1 hypothetical protein [Prosthecochloris sp.]RNA64442.1 hypothetical protein CR163_003805 [Prosthecochloris sp. ZM_2]
MKQDHNKSENLPQTLIRACSCGNYHLHYRYVMVTVPRKTLFHIMEECYEWEEMRAHAPAIYQQKPFRLMIGLVALTILPGDFDEFNNAVQRASNEALDIKKLVGETGSNQ